MNKIANKWMPICKKLYGDSAETIERIGSSAIPGMPGTAAVDLVIGSTNFPPTKEQIESLVKAGFEDKGYAPHDHKKEDYWFSGGEEVPYSNLGCIVLHVESSTNQNLKAYRAFRKYLMEEKEAFDAYAKMKVAQVTGGSDNYYEYKIKKSQLVGKLNQQAFEKYPDLKVDWNK